MTGGEIARERTPTEIIGRDMALRLELGNDAIQELICETKDPMFAIRSRAREAQRAARSQGER